MRVADGARSYSRCRLAVIKGRKNGLGQRTWERGGRRGTFKDCSCAGRCESCRRRKDAGCAETTVNFAVVVARLMRQRSRWTAHVAARRAGSTSVRPVAWCGDDQRSITRQDHNDRPGLPLSAARSTARETRLMCIACYQAALQRAPGQGAPADHHPGALGTTSPKHPPCQIGPRATHHVIRL